MLNIPTPSFPAPSSQQRVSIGRSKVPLKPGRSLMDWIRLTKSGKDLTGLRGRLIEVTEEELAKHNKKDDCWICIRGMVYNITPYMEYHPGGEEELMKAAGVDGTDLFDQVHRWVNYESMLKECLIGKMAGKLSFVSTDGVSVENKEIKYLNGSLATGKMSVINKEAQPRYDWFQADSSVTISIYTKQKNISSELVIVDHEESILRGEIIVGDYSYLLHIELSHAILNSIEVNITGKSGKIEIRMQKKDLIFWKTLGKLLEGHNSFLKCFERALCYRKCRLVSKSNINYNTKLFCFELPQGCHLKVPVGHHVYLKLDISGIDIAKPYTPISSCLLLNNECPLNLIEKRLYLMIKVYPSGNFTPHIDSLATGDYISISNPQGDFSMTRTERVVDIFLLAAGTGITPMVRLLQCILKDLSNLQTVKLIFFNKKQEDILWKEQVEELCLTEKRFNAQFVLSEADNIWAGYRGQISSSLLSESIVRSKEGCKVLICICGPNAFVDQGTRLLQDLGFSKEEVFIFKE
ncbi:hypothetical protein GDO86_009831 [Hymenochirus boettgeri]|uniref:Cytochrome b5 reductase 4 n=1 Tax=Hymenochirus boettgeri TaxID=247094 RepID=A0A8T2JQJ3_9PIPI|nr:hypothetical protein GDO86_009831 [Hymenochirus boettgeri]